MKRCELFVMWKDKSESAVLSLVLRDENEEKDRIKCVEAIIKYCAWSNVHEIR